MNSGDPKDLRPFKCSCAGTVRGSRRERVFTTVQKRVAASDMMRATEETNMNVTTRNTDLRQMLLTRRLELEGDVRSRIRDHGSAE